MTEHPWLTQLNEQGYRLTGARRAVAETMASQRYRLLQRCKVCGSQDLTDVIYIAPQYLSPTFTHDNASEGELATIRVPFTMALSRRLGLPTADKPANACLASRFPYGTAITAPELERVGKAERAVREAGFDVVRVRHHGPVARIEVPPEDRERLLAAAGRVVPALEALGYVWVSMDLEGYRAGSMNEAL